MTSETEVFNLAITHCGSAELISSASENSPVAEKCRLWYPIVRRSVLSMAAWQSARRHARLALVRERDFDADWTAADPAPKYRFAYQWPSDCLRPRYLASYGNFTVEMLGGNRVIETNEEQAILHYMTDQTLVGLWEPNLLMAISYALAAQICMSINGKPQTAQYLTETANRTILEARAADANAEYEPMESLPDWIQARGIAYDSPGRFFYPMASLLVSPA